MKKGTGKVYLYLTTRSGSSGSESLAWEMTNKLSKNQRRKLRRYGVGPLDLLRFLGKIGIVRKGHIPEKSLTVGELLDFLRLYPYETEQAHAYGETLFQEIIQGEVPWLPPNAFGKAEYIWKKMEDIRNFRCGKRGNRAMIK